MTRISGSTLTPGPDGGMTVRIETDDGAVVLIALAGERYPCVEIYTVGGRKVMALDLGFFSPENA